MKDLSVYRELLEAGCDLDHHESDLYIRNTPEARDILAARPRAKVRGRHFVGTDGNCWIEIPFAYDPFWEKPFFPEVTQVQRDILKDRHLQKRRRKSAKRKHRKQRARERALDRQERWK
jgi:hypothetical protein